MEPPPRHQQGASSIRTKALLLGPPLLCLGSECLQDSEFSLETPGTSPWMPGLSINEAAHTGGSKPQKCNLSQLWRPGV